ncbi:unnamed protein product [Linum tenue]|uniref:Cyclin-dependent protein kinase inhibitor SMR1 n=1 Tax=Linum tenue TaxID=586396 RepID=A0AAV0M8C5_9ROSI|nr:unnamed protein product [Linum tenue]
MSADLDSRPSLPKIRVGISLRDAPRPCTSGGGEDEIGCAVALNDNSDRNPAEKEIENSSEEEECRTPKSAEFKIPAVLSCPPAPRKPRRKAIPCKRKLEPEFEFFDAVNREEVESFFRSGFQLAKRIRCPDLVSL